MQESSELTNDDRSRMNHRQINAFRHVMLHGSITAAATALTVSQPAISRLIADLEHALGFALLVRSHGRSSPTAEAYAFNQEVERMFFGLERLATVAAEIRDLRRARLRIASLPVLSFEIVPRAIQQFLARHPGMAITHDVYASTQILDLLASRQIDIGIAQVHAGRGDIEAHAAFRSHCVCVMQPDHPLATRKSLTPADLSDHDLVVLGHKTATWIHLQRRFEEAGIEPRIAAETQPSFSACGLAALGVGIAIVDPITPHVYGRSLETVPFEPSIPFDFAIASPVGLPLSRPGEIFLGELVDAIEKHPGLNIHLERLPTIS
ncbi:MAG: LysR substrate-binding domain-containing protein [Geminicoccaceae bacterium]